MAQAARLDLRLQKELKLLLADPPPGASFPSLSSSPFPSLSSFDAQIEGPGGSVYANGVFKLKIQIPDRYPFQPPIVTFATPIYHPNIDTGGRICLDILNLPPKGAWQPSLNISTVLTSIGLLLSEPNPDDGLMHEASQEYKYNRQAFDHNARSMTEKYARPGESEIADGDRQNETLPENPTSIPTEAKNLDASISEVNRGILSNQNIFGAKRKLSLESSGSNQKITRCKDGNEVSTSAQNLINIGGSTQTCIAKADDFHQNHEELQEMGQKPSREPFGPFQKRNNEENGLPNQCSSLCKTKSTLGGSSMSLLQAAGNSEQKPDPDEGTKWTREAKMTESEKLPLGDKKLICKSSGLSGRMSNCDGKRFTTSQPSATLSGSSMSDQAISQSQSSNHMEMESNNGPVNTVPNGFTGTRHRRLGLAGRKLSLGSGGSSKSQQKDNKENLLPADPPSNSSIMSSMPSISAEHGERAKTYKIDIAHKELCGMTREFPLNPLDQLQGNKNDDMKRNLQSEHLSISKDKPLPLKFNLKHHEKQLHGQDQDEKYGGRRKREGSPASESIIVLDSEDSEDEKEVSGMSKLLLARRRFAERQKANN